MLRVNMTVLIIGSVQNCDEDEPKNNIEALTCINKENWKIAMN